MPKSPQKWILVSEFQKSKTKFGISTSKIPCVLIFRRNGQLWFFWPKFAQKRILGSEFQKSKSGSGSAPPRYHVWYSENFEIFSQNLGKLPNFILWIFDILVLIMLMGMQRAESRLKWAGWRWVHVLAIPKSYRLTVKRINIFLYSILSHCWWVSTIQGFINE